MEPQYMSVQFINGWWRWFVVRGETEAEGEERSLDAAMAAVWVEIERERARCGVMQ